jgi:hypothetical protein
MKSAKLRPQAIFRSTKYYYLLVINDRLAHIGSKCGGSCERFVLSILKAMSFFIPSTTIVESQ